MYSFTLIAGLPGCGKTSLIEKLRKPNSIIFDDLSIILKNEKLSLADFFKNFVKDNTKEFIIADPDLVIAENQNFLINSLIIFDPDVKLNFIFFDNNPKQSSINSNIRNTRDVSISIANLSKLYKISNRTQEYSYKILPTYEFKSYQQNFKRKH